jgi:hypothetical protein
MLLGSRLENGAHMRKALILFNLLAIFAIAVVSNQAAFAQSTNRDRPTPLGSNQLSGELSGDDTEYFFAFVAGPGELTVSLDIKAADANAGAMLDLLDKGSRPLIPQMLAQGVNRGTERVVQTVQLKHRQSILMRLKGIRYGSSGGRGNYVVRFGGVAAPKVSEGDQPGDRLGLPARGMIRLEMNDGSVHEINLSELRRASIKQQ